MPRFSLRLVLVILSVSALTACDKGPAVPTTVVDKTGRTTLRPDVQLQSAKKLDVLFDGRLRLVGVKLPQTVKPGDAARTTLYWLVEKDASSTSPRIFVHGAAPGAQVNQTSADHGPPAPSTEWRRGDLLVDVFNIAVPKELAVDELVVYAGVYEGQARWSTSPKAKDDRVELGRVAIDGAPPLVAKVEVKKRKQPIVVDGKLDEPDWQSATRVGPFRAWDGFSRIERDTHARLVWDDVALYVAFECDDPDPFTPYTNRDDPLYDSEAIEIFVDADGDRDEYVELQATFNDLHFDASFIGGARKGMARGWNADYETKGVVDGASWVSEWRIPVAQLKDVPAGEPKVGASWKVNLFRLERIRRDGKVIRNEASAWSSPLSGDFHHLERFGVITFGE